MTNAPDRLPLRPGIQNQNQNPEPDSSAMVRGWPMRLPAKSTAQNHMQAPPLPVRQSRIPRFSPYTGPYSGFSELLLWLSQSLARLHGGLAPHHEGVPDS